MGQPPAGEGAPGAWEGALAELWPHLYRRAVRRLGDAEAAEDLVQEVMRRAWPALTAGRVAPSALAAYLGRALERQLVDHYRRRARTPPQDPLDPDLPDREGASPLEEVLRRAEARAVREAFRRLPEADRRVLHLRLVEGLSAEAVGRRTGHTAGAVRVLQYRALRRLAALLAERVQPDRRGGSP